MRIAVYHNLPSGGGKRALCEMTRRLAGGHEIDCYTLSCAEHEFGDIRPFCGQHCIYPFAALPLARRPFGRVNQGIRMLDLLRLRGLQQRIARTIDTRQYDVVFVHHCRYGQAPALLQFLATPSVYFCHEPPRQFTEPPVPRLATDPVRGQRGSGRFDPLPAIYRNLLLRLDWAGVRAATRVLTNSDYSRETLYRTYGIFASVCYLGVDTERFQPLSLPREDFVLSVGALNGRKGFDFLIESLGLIPVAERPPLVVISNAGDTNEQRHLEQLAARLGVAVAFQTLVSDEALVNSYNRAALTLYAPVMEPFGFVPIESMACGTPVVGVREGGVRETIRDGETGLLVERDPPSFADAVGALLADPGRAEAMGRAGRLVAETRWQWDVTAKTVGDHLASAAGKAKAVKINTEVQSSAA